MKRLSPKQELDLLHQITHIISCATDLPELLKSICKMVAGVLGSDSCLIYLYEEKENSLVLSGAQNAHAGALGKVKMKLGEGITGWVAAHKRPVAISEKSYEDPRFKFFSSLPEDKYESFLSVPILTRGQLVGVINLHRKKIHEYPPRKLSSFPRSPNRRRAQSRMPGFTLPPTSAPNRLKLWLKSPNL